MKLLSAKQIRDWDQFTIEHEPIASIDLMERAAMKCVEWLEQHQYSGNHFFIFCGKGNNGGDGLAIARMLSEQNNYVSVYILESGHKGSDDFQANLFRLQQMARKDIHFIQSETSFPILSSRSIIVDALFGSGLNRPLEGLASKLIEHINNSGGEIISIDVPSGLLLDSPSKGNAIVKTTHTVSIHTFKWAFLIADNEEFVGKTHIIDIDLDPNYLSTISVDKELVDDTLIRSIYKPRDPFAHKGNFGHALIVAGSYGKIGAAILATKSCLRSGAGLVTSYIPQCGYNILQTAVPEAMALTDMNPSFVSNVESDVSKYNVIGIGPGIGTAKETRAALKKLLQQFSKPMVIDADGLNCISQEEEIRYSLPPHSILTPHPKEFDRLFGETKNDFVRVEKALHYSRTLDCFIVLKGHHTFISTPSGKGYFNNTGNAGMATAGSGDVLTGILTGLIAQGYSSEQAAILGVYLHGLAGDIAAHKFSEEAMLAEDITENIGEAFFKMGYGEK